MLKKVLDKISWSEPISQQQWNIFAGFIVHIKEHAPDTNNPIIFLILHSSYFSSDLTGVPQCSIFCKMASVFSFIHKIVA